VLGGAKVADKFDAFGHLLATADRILVGGAMAFRRLGERPPDHLRRGRDGPGRLDAR
jgi:hypothetical protein